jgi:diguanylate cyclase
MSKMMEFRIIVIDDNPQIQNDFIKILVTDSSSIIDDFDEKIFGIKNPELELPQFQIDTASQGEEGVALVEKALREDHPYALAFVDIRMPPGLDGVETIKKIWELDENIQVVICTAYSDYTWEQTIERLGQRDNLLILKKPFDNVAVRQLALALTKKWEILQKGKHQTSQLQQQVSEQSKSLQTSLSEVKYQATHDFLTGLPNRVYLYDKLKEAINNAKLNSTKCALLFCDMDRFKIINDSLGHVSGDEFLQAIASRLREITSERDTLARLGGDEFLIVISELFPGQDINLIAQEYLKLFQQPFKIANRNVVATASIGISVYPEHGQTADELLRNADAAMFCAKEYGGNNCQMYTELMNSQSLAELEQEIEIRRAINNNEFFLCYQPQVDLKSQKILGVEALIRWQHPTKGLLLPIDFIELAEKTGLVVAIGEWVMRTACFQNKMWLAAGYEPIRMAVNVTAQQFKHQNLVATVKNILLETQLDPALLEVEITENVVISSAEIIETIKSLKALGVIIALDDFGTGFSGLSYLKKIPLDRLKIDASFVKNIACNTGDEVIIRAIIAMANSLNLDVLAEGVETKKQLEFLISEKCGEGQGYYFSKPIVASELERLLVKLSVPVNKTAVDKS